MARARATHPNRPRPQGAGYLVVMVTSVAVLVSFAAPGLATAFVPALEPAAVPTVVWTVTVAPVVTSVLAAEDWP